MKKSVILLVIAALILTTGCSSSSIKKEVAAQQEAINKLQYEITRQTEELKALQANASNDSIDGVAIKDIIIGQQYQLEQMNKQLTNARKDLYRHLNETGTVTTQYDISASGFKVGSAELTEEAISLLDGLLPELNEKQSATVKVLGHTDNTGSEAINKSLSLRRANSVKAYLVSKGIDEGRISAEGLSSSKPAACNDNAEGRFKNRRVEVLVNKDQE